MPIDESLSRYHDGLPADRRVELATIDTAAAREVRAWSS